MKHKTVTLVNPINGEKWVTDNFKATRIIDGVDYIEVYKTENRNRKLFMRKDALKLDNALFK